MTTPSIETLTYYNQHHQREEGLPATDRILLTDMILAARGLVLGETRKEAQEAYPEYVRGMVELIIDTVPHLQGDEHRDVIFDLIFPEESGERIPELHARKDINYREVAWGGYTVETELDDEGNYILAFRDTGTEEVMHSVGLTPEQADFLFSIPSHERGM
jgi:hypothetical protein